ncbi:3',5'-cyclic adenosine monophosphate phosphodiesterase CpdA [uncultured archaeon]|nr:3',5'-cyclic adenosine monophosphate phosphodiesterase CpdA [uncultured archaeon]
MRLQLISDLHTEFRRGGELAFIQYLPIEKGLDFLVVAGDLVVFAEQGEVIIKAIFGAISEMARHVIYVTGNHEYYGSTKEWAEEQLREVLSLYPNIHWLDNSEITLDGVHFVGGSMWYPDVDGLNYVKMYMRMMNDFYAIKLFDWAERENTRFNAFVNGYAGQDTIVVTHHLPHPRCTPLEFVHSALNRYFVSDQSWTLATRKPKLWLFGHTHREYDGQLSETRLVCNPFGYPGERNSKNPYKAVVFDV